MGLLKPESGQLKIFGKPVSNEKDFLEVRRRIGLLFQDSDDQLFSPTVLEDVTFGPLNLGKTTANAIDIARKTLAYLGLTDFEDRVTFKLSGGEKRLVSLATVLAMEPQILLLDEPINGLDTKTQKIITDILSRLELSYIIISHDIDFLAETTNALYTMQEGRILLDNKLSVHKHVHAHPHGTYPHKHEEGI
jgi:cobalt/nickel transport system ATP-binding protein